MRSLLFSLALCAAVQAAPADPVFKSTTAINGASTILPQSNNYIPSQDDTTRARVSTPQSKHLHGDRGRNRRVRPTTTATTTHLPRTTTIPHPSATTTGSVGLISEEDPELISILVNVEDILLTSAPSSQQIQWIVDAITHHQPSHQPTSYKDLWTSDNILDLVDDVLTQDTGSLSDDEKVDVIFKEIASHSRHNTVSVVSDIKEPVLLRVKAILYGEGDCQQKIKKILGEIAGHLHLEGGVAGPETEQVSLGEVGGSAPAEVEEEHADVSEGGFEAEEEASS